MAGSTPEHKSCPKLPGAREAQTWPLAASDLTCRVTLGLYYFPGPALCGTKLKSAGLGKEFP